MNLIPIAILIVFALGLLLWTQRQRQRSAAEEVGLRERLQVGSPVMTTSGLYGTIRSIDEEEDTVQLEIADGIQVRWAFAALRDRQSLPDRYRPGTEDAEPPATSENS